MPFEPLLFTNIVYCYQAVICPKITPQRIDFEVYMKIPQFELSQACFDPLHILDSLSLEHIEKALICLEGKIRHTPTLHSSWLSKMTNSDVFLKLENLQITGSFKPRGAYIKMQSLTEDKKFHGVITMSAGNHAQGVAYFARELGIPATIVMPENTPITKVEHTQALGASVILHGQNMNESRDFALQLIKTEGFTLVHTFDDPYVIAGQGTVGLEFLKSIPDLDILLIPIGGGGLGAGVSIVAKALNPNIQIIGVQSSYCPAMAEFLFPNKVIRKIDPGAQTIAEGIAIKFPGELTRTILKANLDDMIVVSEDLIETAIDELATEDKIVVEGAGAAGVAAILSDPSFFEGKRVGTIICGGNIDARVFSNVLLRGLVHSGRLVRYRIEINDSPGVLSRLTLIIGKNGGNIFEISHQRLFNHLMAKMAYVDAVVETRDGEHAKAMANALNEAHFPTEIVD